MFILTVLTILTGCIVALVIYYQEKNKEAAREIKRLKQNIVSAGYNFEQLEFNIEKIRQDLKSLDKEENFRNVQTTSEKIKNQLEEIMKILKSGSRL